MKKIIACLFTLLSILAISAQTTTTGDDVVTTPSESTKNNVLIIPFESKMYLSDIDKDLALKNEMNFQDIKAKFRAALDREIFIALKQYYKPLSFYAIEPKEAMAELAYIYNSIGFKYAVMPEEVVVKKENAGAKLLGKFKKKPKKAAYVEAGINDGQVVSQVDNREKYMKTTLANEKLLPNLNSKFKASHYIFINQLDIKRSADMRYVSTEEQHKREIKVHYTIFDNAGKEVSTGAIKSRFASNQNDIDKIIKIQFPLIAQQIVNNLIGPDKVVVE